MTNAAKKITSTAQAYQHKKLLSFPESKKGKKKDSFAPSAPVPAIRRQLKHLHNLSAALFISGVTFQILLTAFSLATISKIGHVCAMVLELIGFGFSGLMISLGFCARWIAINVDSNLHDVRHMVYRK